MSAEQDLANANVQIANLISEVTRFRDAAMGINNLWPTITEGRQNTADGKYFSVPGDGAYLKLYRRAGTSQTLIAEFPDRAQVQGIVDVFGGRGVTNGLSNLGQDNDLVRLSDAVFASRAKFGIYYSPSSNSNIDEAPAGGCGLYSSGGQGIYPGNDSFYWVETQPIFDGNALVQRACVYSNSTNLINLKPRSFSRICSNTLDSEGKRIWGAWGENFTKLNILGTVSQSGGVPTGAIIERGSNANGEYVKFADGSLFFSSVKDVNVASSGVQFFTPPVVFIPGYAPTITVGHVSTSSPNPALYFDNIRALFLDPSAGYALRLKTAGVSSAPGTNSERLIFSAWARWY